MNSTEDGDMDALDGFVMVGYNVLISLDKLKVFEIVL